MRNLISILLVVFLLLALSCAGTPEVQDEQIELPESVEITEEDPLLEMIIQEPPIPEEDPEQQPEEILDMEEFLDSEELLDHEEISDLDELLDLDGVLDLVDEEDIDETQVNDTSLDLLLQEQMRSAELAEQLEREQERVRELEEQLLREQLAKEQERSMELAEQLEREQERIRELEDQLLQEQLAREQALAQVPAQSRQFEDLLEREMNRIRELEEQLARERLAREQALSAQPPVQPPPAEPPPAETPVQQQPEEPPVQTQPPPPPLRSEPEQPIQPVRGESSELAAVTAQDSDIIFSRVVRVTVGQILEIPFRGTGWVYLGELASRRGISLNSRRNDNEGQTFVFNIEEAGTFILRFYRQDYTRGFILNDYVQVIVEETRTAGGAGWFNAPLDRGRIVAEPRWPSALEEAEIIRGSGTSAAGAAPVYTPGTITPVQEIPAPPDSPAVQGFASQDAALPDSSADSSADESASQPSFPIQESGALPVYPGLQSPVADQPDGSAELVQERIQPELLLQRAQQVFDTGNVAGAIALVDQYIEYYPGGSDEAYWLYGQFYEAASPNRNILLSLDYYRRLVNEYPQSSRLSAARSRVAYLERFYINIQ